MSSDQIDPARLSEVQRWMRYAREDLDSAKAIARSRSLAPRLACFLAQQCAEKALKAGLVLLNIEVPFRHDLDRLRQLLPTEWAIAAAPVDLATLTEWAVEARYPGPAPDPDKRDARTAIAIAQVVYDRVLVQLLARGVLLAP